MHTKFESSGHSYHVEFFQTENSCMIRFYNSENENYGNILKDLVLVEPSFGYLLVQYIGEDAVLSGTLYDKYFSRDMTEDVICFVEKHLPGCRNIYFPYHIDFISVSGSEAYNGEF